MKDILIAAATRQERAAFALRALYDSYGYAPYTMSKFEEYDLYVRNKNFLISDSVITFTDRTGRLLALKPDVTLSIVKNTRDNQGDRTCVYYDENVYRVLPGESTFREIRQVGLECIGQIDTYALCETVTLALQSLATLSSTYVLELSHLDIVSGVLDALRVDDAARGALLRCLAQKNTHDLFRLARDAGADEEATAALCRLVTTSGGAAEVLPVLRELEEKGYAPAFAVEQLETLMRALSFAADRIRIDFSLVNDMNYYNGIVFRGFLLGVAEGVLSGGQYDRLMRKMDRRADAVGFAVYLDALDRLPDEDAPDEGVDVWLVYDETIDPVALCAAAGALRRQGNAVCVTRTRPKTARGVAHIDAKGEVQYES